MARYLMNKYKGIYRIKAHINQFTNDYPRMPDTGEIDPSYDDLYIKCDKGSQIYHYGQSILVAYIPSIGRGHNILKAIGERLLGSLSQYEGKIFDYEALYEDLKKEGTVKDIIENDAEIEFKFNNTKIDLVAKYLKPQISGADISPFSTRNLPKSTYSIPADDIAAYKEITAEVPQENKLLISQITKRFLNDILAKDKLYRTIDMKTDMRKKILKSKEYIHSMGYWEKYISYLKKEIGKNAKNITIS